MDVIFHPDIEPAMAEFREVNDLRPLLIYGVDAVQEYPGTLLPDERLFLVYAKPAAACVHTSNRFTPARIHDTCGFDRTFDIEDVAASLIDRTCLSYDVFRADKWARVYYYDELISPMVCKSRSKDGRYEMYNPRALGESYLEAFDRWQARLDREFDADLFFDCARMLLTAGKLVSNIQSNSGVPQLVPLDELIHESGSEFEKTVLSAREKWSRGEDIPESWDDLPDEITDVMRSKRNEQIMILHSVKHTASGTDPYPKEALSKLYADFVFDLHDIEKQEAASR